MASQKQNILHQTFKSVIVVEYIILGNISMSTNTSKIISLLLKEKIFKERKDSLGYINSGSNHYFEIMLNKLENSDCYHSSKNQLMELKSYFDASQELLEYYDFLMNAIYMDEIKRIVTSIFSHLDLIHDEMHAVLIKDKYHPNEVTRRQSFIKDVNNKIERIKLIISGYNTLQNPEHIYFEIKGIKSIFESNNCFNIVINTLADSISENAKTLYNHKNSMFNYYKEKAS